MQGGVRNIGVSNFGVKHLEKLLKTAEVVPAVNQIELSPFLQRKELVEYCRSKGIALEVRAQGRLRPRFQLHHMIAFTQHASQLSTSQPQ